MTPAAPPPSSRLLRAAVAERAELDRHRERLFVAREQLRAELARVDAGLAEVDERRRLLDRLVPAAVGAHDDEEVEGREGPETPATLHQELGNAVDGSAQLRGTAIRETAVRLLLERRDGVEALHYRDWFELVVAEGYSIAGKDPLAVFLTQISRSPVVRRSTQAGIYEVDYAAPAHLGHRLEELHEVLRELSASPQSPLDLAAVRARRQELTAEIGQVEKALEEASRLLGPASEQSLVGVA
jgi:hypothetical protein